MEDDAFHNAFGRPESFPDEHTESLYYWYYGQPHLVGLPYWERCVDYPGTLLDLHALLGHLARKYKWRWPGLRYKRFYIETVSKPLEGYARWEVRTKGVEFDHHGDPDVPSIAIEAYEEPKGHTFVYFMDSGFYNQKPTEQLRPIEDDFLRIVDTIVEEMPGAKPVLEPKPRRDGDHRSRAPAVPPGEQEDADELTPEDAVQNGMAPGETSDASTTVVKEDASARPGWFPKTPDTIEKWRNSYLAILQMREEYRELYEDGETDEPNPSIGEMRERLADMEEWTKKPSESTVYHILKAGRMNWYD